MSKPIFALILEDESQVAIDPTETIGSLVRRIARQSVETIVVGEVDGRTILWEKQFGEMTVMPTGFGKQG